MALHAATGAAAELPSVQLGSRTAEPAGLVQQNPASSRKIFKGFSSS